MASTAEILITPTTSAISTPWFFVNAGESVGVYADALVSAEEASIQWSADAGTTAVNLQQGGNAVALTATHNAERINGPGLFRLTKTTTASACGVYIFRNRGHS